MKRFFHVCIWLVAAVLTLGPVVESVQAGMDAQMQGMFGSFGALATTSPPGAFQGQTRNAYTGGSLEMRFQNQQMSLFSISPPRLSVGCGGIDAYLGGFSYGSLDRYVSLLQQLGTGAVLGYAFQLAMKFICPDCADVLNKLEAAARAMNTLGRINPCNAGQAVQQAMKAGEAIKAVGTSASTAWESSLIGRNLIKDPIDGQDVRATKTTQDANNDIKSAGSTSLSGNLVWAALGAANPPVDPSVRHLIMSVLGTVVVDDNVIPHYHPPTLEFKDILQTRTGETPTIILCDEEVNCVNVTEGPSAGDFSGFQEQTQTALGNLATAVANGVAPAPADINFVNAASIAVWRLLLDHGKTQADRDLIIRYSSDIIATDLAFYYVSYLRRELVKHVLNYKKVNPDFIGDADNFLVRLDEVMTQMNAEVAVRNASHEKSRQVMKFYFKQPVPRTARK